MKKMKVHFFCIAILCLLFLSACEIVNDEDTNVSIEPLFDLHMQETLGAQKDLDFELSTVQTQPCENASILSSLSQSNNAIQVILGGIVAPENCITGDVIICKNVGLNELKSDQYEVLFTLRNSVQNEGVLLVMEDRYQLILDTKDGLRNVTTEIMRLPNDVIWGYVGYDGSLEVDDVLDGFLDDLADILEPIDLPNGNYGHFVVDPNGVTLWTGKVETTRFQPFLFQRTEGDSTELKDLLNNYRNLVLNDAIVFKIFADNGETW